MERRPPPVPVWWCLSFSDPNQYLSEKGKSSLRTSLRNHEIDVHWGESNKIWIVVATNEAAITCWALGYFDLIDALSIKVRTYTPNDGEARKWIREQTRIVDPYLI